jgi:hypothetical protein
MSNLDFIKEFGVEKFTEQQNRRIRLLETMIKDFDDGRSRSFFCRAAGLLDLSVLENSVDKATREIRTDNINRNDVKSKAGIMRTILNEATKV